jgi:toxin ParE1/3/4
VRAELHPEARLEIRSAALWYDEQTPGLGDRFIAQVTAALIAIEEHPELYPTWPGLSAGQRIRKAGLDRFPYLVAFEVQESRVLVLALAHARRRPLYWLHRATDES